MLGDISITVLLQVLEDHQHSNHQNDKSLHHVHTVLAPANDINIVLLKVRKENLSL